MIKADQAPKKKTSTVKKNNRPSAEEDKKKVREEKLKADEESRHLKQRQAVEDKRITEEVAEFNQRL